jgi:hypothetical protein
METLKINKANALKAYKEAPKEGKQLLSNLFGKGVLSENIMERIHDFSDILDEAGISEEEFAEQIKGLSEDEIAYKKMKLFTSVLNEGWGPDWNDSNEYKWYPYFDMGSKSGFGFSDAMRATSVRVRLSARAFVLNLLHWQNLLENCLYPYIKLF